MRLRSVVLSIWSVWDPIYYALSSRRYIEQKGIDHNIFRVRLTRYKGKNVWLSDGTCIRKNDLLLRIHLHNVFLLKELLHLKNDVRKGKCLHRIIKNSLPGLAHYLRHHPRRDDIRAIVGITTLNRGCGTLGFETVPISNMYYKLYKQVTLMPIYLLSAEHPIETINKNIPAYLFMPKQKLLNAYHDIHV